jgi:hypothetical protein
MFFPKYILFDQVKKAVSGITKNFLKLKWSSPFQAEATEYKKTE